MTIGTDKLDFIAVRAIDHDHRAEIPLLEIVLKQIAG